MDLDTMIVTVFCQIDDSLQIILDGGRLRERGRSPKLTDAEVLTMELVGEYLGFSQDKQIFQYFVRHYQHFFPALGAVHRTTFVRRSANLRQVKEKLWQQFLPAVKFDSQVSPIDSFPVEVCRFARAARCRRLREISAYGFDARGAANLFRCQISFARSIAGRDYGFPGLRPPMSTNCTLPKTCSSR